MALLVQREQMKVPEGFAMLILHIENVDDLAIVECEGRIVRSEAAFALREAVASLEGVRIILLDLSRVSAIEGGGLGMLMFLQRWASDHRIGLKLFNPTPSVRDRLELAHSIPDFEIVALDEMPTLLASACSRSACRAGNEDDRQESCRRQMACGY